MLVPGIGTLAATPAAVVLQETVKKYELQEPYYSEIQNIMKTMGVDLTRENHTKIAQVYIPHQMIKGFSASDGSTYVGDVIYLWNFTTPNPRYQITKDGVPLHSISATTKAHCFAHQDRTPDIFLSDFFSDASYHHPDYGTFKTFGWCAEKEMAYGVLLGAFNIDTDIIAPGAHAYSEVVVDVTVYGQNRPLTIQVDNTFDKFYPMWAAELPEWHQPESRLQVWYNMQKEKNMDLMSRLSVSDSRRLEILMSL